MDVAAMEHTGKDTWGDMVGTRNYLQLDEFFNTYCQAHPAAQLAEMQSLLKVRTDPCYVLWSGT